MKEFKCHITYTVDGTNYDTRELSNEHYDIVFSQKEEVTKAVLYPKTTITNLKAVFETVHLCTPQAKIFVNGYQSWTDSKEFTVKEKMPKSSFPGVILPVLKNYGDETFVKYPTSHGIFHGFTYAYIRELNKVCLYGSMTEALGFTIIQINTKQNSVKIYKDVEGVTFTRPYEILNVGYFVGEYDEVFDRYFQLQNLPALRLKNATGYTSWYNYYTKVTRDDIERDLKSFKDRDITPGFFQIDDGYQTNTGDWLSIKPEFGDMKQLTDEIHNNKIAAGLWLAPFACIKASDVYKKHQDWLLRDSKGKLVKAGLNWDITGFLVLDILKPQVQDYLKEVFDTVINKWGFDMVKLDFLYATCMIPRENKSRGQIMCEAMDFIRACVGNKLILGCGVPLGAAFGKVDFCRIGCDVNLKWADSFVEKKMHRERVSTVNTLNNTIFRRHLNGRAFVNDPDVFFLRDYNIKLTPEQKSIIADVNKIFGGVLFISDDISTYDDTKLKMLKEVFSNQDIEVQNAEYITPTVISIEYTINNLSQTFTFDMQQGTIIHG